MITLEHERNYLKVQKQLITIRRFAKEMGYKTCESNYEHPINNRQCHYIELLGTWDSDGEPFTWAWYTDTWEEV